MRPLIATTTSRSAIIQTEYNLSAPSDRVDRDASNSDRLRFTECHYHHSDNPSPPFFPLQTCMQIFFTVTVFFIAFTLVVTQHFTVPAA